ncbi:hypothetical protein BN3589_03017 [Clostridium sp. C105KSO14]|nr:hypothetical protein BN3589_03017 [Clostridium sp. C105KSO14]
MIGDAVRQAQRMHRKAIEATYDGTCRIYGMQSVKDPVTKVTRQEEVLVQDGIACHLSYSSTVPAAGSDTVTGVAQTIKLFLAPELVVPPGSRIEVTQQGRIESYAQSGKAAVYSSHQEILLEIWKEYA